MSSLTDPTYLRIHQLVTDWLEGEDQARVRSELSQLLANDDRAASIYLQYMQESAGLRWQSTHSEIMQNEIESFLPERYVESTTTKKAAIRPDVGRRSAKYFAAAVTILVAAGTMFWLSAGKLGPAEQPPVTLSKSQIGPAADHGTASNQIATASIPGATETAVDEIATLTRLIHSQWRDGTSVHDALSRLRAGDELRLETGQAEILFDSGVEVVLTGPAHLKVESQMSASVEYGTFSARVGPRGKGFTIHTPSAEVVDLGTEFGLAVNQAGDTEVAVFSGIVDLSYDDSNAGINTTRQRLNQGEALRVGLNGQAHRVVSIDSERFPMAGSQWDSRSKPGSVIESVSDNLSFSNSRSFYRIVRGGFAEDAHAFVDRGHQWNGLDESGIPDFLIGADYIMPFNDDKLQESLEVTVVLAKPAVVYLLFDNNMNRPDWLTDRFVDTGVDIGLDEDASIYRAYKSVGLGPATSIDDTFSIWQCELPTGGPIVLGGVSAPEHKSRGYNMYGIIAVPMSEHVLD
ncbi:MAG: FecR family protein [Planctomycetota bacterium]